MAGSVAITPTSVPVVPGATAVCQVRIRNTGVVVDQYTLTVLGQPAVWTTAVPAVLSLFPGAEGTIDLHFAPPRAPGVGSGGVPFGVRVEGSQDPDGSVVEEGEVELLSYVDVQAKLTPRTSEAKRAARHEVLLDNRGNTDIEAEIDVSDPDELLAFEVRPRTVVVPAGQSARVAVKVAARRGFLKGSDKQRPFQVRVSGAEQPILLDGTLMQTAGMPRFIVPLVAGAVALSLIVVMFPLLKKDAASGKLSLTSDNTPTTTAAPPADAPPAAEEPDPNAPATAEEAAAAAEAEKAANGKDPGTAPSGVVGATTGSGGDAEVAVAGEAVAAPTGSGNGGGGGGGGDVSSVVTSPTATTAAPPPGSTTTTAAATTTTTTPSSDGSLRGTFSFDFDAGVETSTGADVFWQQATSTSRSLTPQNGALLFNMGAANYDAVTVAQLKSLAYTGASIDGSDSTNKMPPGTVIAIKTNTGRYAKMRVTAKAPAPSNTLTFKYFTYPTGS